MTNVHARLGIRADRIALVDAAPVLFRALQAGQLDQEGRAIIDAVEAADALVIGSPVYRASYTGALKHLFDLVNHRALTGKPVILAATACARGCRASRFGSADAADPARRIPFPS